MNVVIWRKSISNIYISALSICRSTALWSATMSLWGLILSENLGFYFERQSHQITNPLTIRVYIGSNFSFLLLYLLSDFGFVFKSQIPIKFPSHTFNDNNRKRDILLKLFNIVKEELVVCILFSINLSFLFLPNLNRIGDLHLVCRSAYSLIRIFNVWIKLLLWLLYFILDFSPFNSLSSTNIWLLAFKSSA